MRLNMLPMISLSVLCEQHPRGSTTVACSRRSLLGTLNQWDGSAIPCVVKLKGGHRRNSSMVGLSSRTIVLSILKYRCAITRNLMKEFGIPGNSSCPNVVKQVFGLRLRRSDYRKAVDNTAGTFYKDMFHSHLKRGVRVK